MSDPTTPSGELQFDRVEAEGAQAPGACAECGQPIRDVYYEVNGRVLCDRCRQAEQASWSAGSSAGRFGKALVFGLAAAAAGSGLYYGVLALTGYEFGLIAIVVGLLVGAAVRKGSNGRGGWKYQALAMFLTYTSIVSSYVPMIIQEVQHQESASPAVADSAGGPIVPDSGIGSAAVPGPSNPVLLLLLALGVIYALPFLAGFENILGIVVIAIGLYEAWKLNKRAELSITGPFKVAV
jgi:hypothetical protein